MREAIRTFSGSILGYVEDNYNGDLVAKTFSGKILGYYKKSNNTSTNFAGKILGYGDYTVAMILQASNVHLDI